MFLVLRTGIGKTEEYLFCVQLHVEALHLHTDSIDCTSLQATFVVLFVEQTPTGGTVNLSGFVDTRLFVTHPGTTHTDNTGAVT